MERGRVMKLMKKTQSLTGIALIVILWQLLTALEIIPSFILPSPLAILEAMIEKRALLFYHAEATLLEAFLGLTIGIVLGFIIALTMERFSLFYQMLYPILVISQTIPIVAIAPVLIIWFGYGILPKVVIVVVSSLFPIAIGLLDGFRSVDPDRILLLKSMQATDRQIIRYAKLPEAQPYFFSSLRISATYGLIGAVLAELLGGNSGLGVYLTRARKSYAFDEMFAIIFLTTLISLALVGLIKRIEKLATPWKKEEERRKNV